MDKILGFMNSLDNNLEKMKSEKELMNNPVIKKNRVDRNVDTAKKDCMNYIFKTTFKEAIPLDANVVDDFKADNMMKDFLNRRSADGTADLYIREAIKKRNNPALRQLVESVDRLVSSSFSPIYASINTLTIESLDWDMDNAMPKLNTILSDANLDEVSKNIKENVKDVMANEIEKIKKRKEEEQALINDLKSNDEMVSEESINRELDLLRMKDKSIYKPHLFESVLINCFNHPIETAEESKSAYDTAVMEYTLLNVAKALRCEAFDINYHKICNEYATSKFIVGKTDTLITEGAAINMVGTLKKLHKDCVSKFRVAVEAYDDDDLKKAQSSMDEAIDCYVKLRKEFVKIKADAKNNWISSVGGNLIKPLVDVVETSHSWFQGLKKGHILRGLDNEQSTAFGRDTYIKNLSADAVAGKLNQGSFNSLLTHVEGAFKRIGSAMKSYEKKIYPDRKDSKIGKIDDELLKGSRTDLAKDTAKAISSKLKNGSAMNASTMRKMNNLV